MKALVIGYGSIGQRHHDVLSSMEVFEEIHIVTSQTLQDITTFRTLESTPDIETYNYFVIASETNKHLSQLLYLDTHVKNKTILCEKPLFDIYLSPQLNNNTIYVGYVLRFHPIFDQIKSHLNNEIPILISIKAGSYLPSWRPQRDYRTLYSASKEQGGGVLLDLSHEIDYTQWLFEPLQLLNSFQGHITDLEINSDDLTMITAKTDQISIISITLDYFTKIPYREIMIHTNTQTIQADLISNTIKIGNLSGEIQTISLEPFERNELFIKMHFSALGDKKNLCTFQEGLSVMKTITNIQESHHA